jgi:hypothetical protein
LCTDPFKSPAPLKGGIGESPGAGTNMMIRPAVVVPN